MQKVKSFEPQENLKRAHRKENNFMNSYTVVAMYKGNFIEVLDLRIYGTKAMNYACLWVHPSTYKGCTAKAKDVYASGSGSAGGYGYHRPSAAAQSAITMAGFTLEESIDGRGDRAIEDACLAMAKYFGYRKLHLVKSHG